MVYSKLWAYSFSLVVLGAILWPIKEHFREQPVDNFPLSYFPMFSLKRDSVITLNYFVGYDQENNRVPIHYRYIGSGGFNQVRRQVNKSCKTSPKSQKITAKVAKRVSKCSEKPFRDVVRVALVKGDYHLDRYFLKEEKMPVNERILAEQTIERP